MYIVLHDLCTEVREPGVDSLAYQGMQQIYALEQRKNIRHNAIFSNDGAKNNQLNLSALIRIQNMIFHIVKKI